MYLLAQAVVNTTKLKAAGAQLNKADYFISAFLSVLSTNPLSGMGRAVQ